MGKIGIFFGTHSGSTRLVAKKLSRKLGTGLADAPLNVNRITTEAFLAYDAFVLGTPTYGAGQLPSASLGAPNGGWVEFLEQLGSADLSGKSFALFGLGDQEKHGDHFVSALGILHDFICERGGRVVGKWSTEGYTFSHSDALRGEDFCGLALDTATQPLLTEQRLDNWAEVLKREFGFAQEPAGVEANA